MSAHNSLYLWPIDKYGTPEQKEQFVQRSDFSHHDLFATIIRRPVHVREKGKGYVRIFRHFIVVSTERYIAVIIKCFICSIPSGGEITKNQKNV